MKQTVASCLAAAMVLGVLPVTARAASLQGGAAPRDCLCGAGVWRDGEHRGGRTLEGATIQGEGARQRRPPKLTRTRESEAVLRSPEQAYDPLPWSLSTRTLSLQVQREVQAWATAHQAAGTQCSSKKPSWKS